MSRVIPVTGTFSVTVTAHSALKLPSSAVAMILATPTETGVTIPFDDTVATDVLSDFHVTFLLLASDGEILTDSSPFVPPTDNSIVSCEIAILFTD